MIRYLYEVAVLDPVASRRYREKRRASSAHLFDCSATSLPQGRDASQSIGYQLHNSQQRMQAAGEGSMISNHDSSYAASSSMSYPPARQYSWESNAQSVSGFSSEGSVSSWENMTDVGSCSSSGLRCFHDSQDGLQTGGVNPSLRHSSFTDIVFASSPQFQEDIFLGPTTATDIPCHEDKVTPHSAFETAKADEPAGNLHIDKMLAQATQDLGSLPVAANGEQAWQVQGLSPCPGMYERSIYGRENYTNDMVSTDEVTNSTLNVGFQNLSLATPATNSHNFILSTDRDVSLFVDSGEVLSASSLTSLSASSGSVSENSLADVESCETYFQLRDRKFTRKPMSSTSEESVFSQPWLNCLRWTNKNLEEDGPASTSSVYLRGVYSAESLESESTSGYCESASAYSLPCSDTSSLNSFSFPNVHYSCNNNVHGPNFSPPSWHADLLGIPVTPSHGGFQVSDSGPVESSHFARLCERIRFNPNETVFHGVRETTRRSVLSFNERGEAPIQPCLFQSLTDACNNNGYVDFESAVESSPYECKIPHDTDFTPIQNFTVQKLPEEFQTVSTLQTILSISQRVVKILVRKPFRMNSSEVPLEPKVVFPEVSFDDLELDHYGSGFACYVDRESIIIRTHSEVVGSAMEASNAEVTFQITFPDGSGSHSISCSGQSQGFSSSDHSQTTKFTCRTPQELLQFLHLFSDVPVVQHSSLLYDSGYSTDADSDNSVSDFPSFHQLDSEVEKPQLSNHQRTFRSIPTPLLIMERNYQSSLRGACSISCPYAGLNLFGGNGLFKNFSSFAGKLNLYSKMVVPLQMT